MLRIPIPLVPTMSEIVAIIFTVAPGLNCALSAGLLIVITGALLSIP